MSIFGKPVSRRHAVQGMAGLATGAMGGLLTLPKIRLPEGVAAIPAPPFRDVATAPRAEVLAYARSVKFDDSYHASDERRLFHDDGVTILRGPNGFIAPAAGAIVTDEADIRKGRIVGHVRVDADWPHQALWKGENYIWFDARGGILRAVLVPEDPSRSLTNAPVRIIHGPGEMGTGGPEARFRWDRTCCSLWISCSGGCCQVTTDGPNGPTRPKPDTTSKL